MKKKRTKLLVTAGPTREYIDPVRYISNDSSGRMGFAIAAAARDLGCDVTLVAGPVSLARPAGVRGIAVTSAREMREETLKASKDADIVIMAAAVADWRPKSPRRSKMKKSAKAPSIEFVENPDILADICGKRREGQTIVGFALETKDLERSARAKMKRKGCDWIVANRATAIGAASSSAILIGLNGERVELPCLPKEDLAVVILSHIMC